MECKAYMPGHPHVPGTYLVLLYSCFMLLHVLLNRSGYTIIYFVSLQHATSCASVCPENVIDLDPIVGSTSVQITLTEVCTVNLGLNPGLSYVQIFAWDT